MTGTVRELWRWPVKGMGGERMPSVRVDGRGVGGDRTHAVLRAAADGAPHPLAPDAAPVLASWVAAYPFNIGANVDPASPPYTLATGPDGRTFVWNDPRLRYALEDGLGHPVRLRRDLQGLQHVERTVLLVWGDLDIRRLRANVLLELDGEPPRPGEVVEFDGGVRMRILRDCETGGAYARVVAAGRVAVGAAVQPAGR